MFLFYLLGVGLPCRLIFCQLWLCEEAQCVYLHLHLGSPTFLGFEHDCVCAYVSPNFLSYKDNSHIGLGSTFLQYHFILTNYTCGDPISK